MQCKTYIPEAWGKPVETPQDVLRAAADLLEEEGRWRQGSWYNHDDISMEEWEDNPYCNGWGACADGAMRIVSIGMWKHETNRTSAIDGCSCRDCENLRKHNYTFDWTTDVYRASAPDHRPDPAAGVLYSAARRAADDYLASKGAQMGIVNYNDTVAQGRDDVVNVLRASADMLDGSGG